MTQSPYFYRGYSHTASETAKRLWFYVRSVGWFRCSPEYEVHRSAFPGYQLKYVVRGQGYVEWQGQPLLVQAGQIFLLDLRQPHRYYADRADPWELLWIQFEGVQSQDYYHLLEADIRPVYDVLDTEHMERCFREVYELFRNKTLGMEASSSAAITQIFCRIIVDRMRSGAIPPSLSYMSYPEPVKQGILFMEAHFQQALQLEDIAQHATLSPYHYARMFKRETGHSVMEYLTQFRLQQARYLLSDTSLSVRVVSEQCGFPDQSYFSRVFKQAEHTTPSAYRSLCKRNVDVDEP